MAVADTKVPLFKDHFWHFQIKIKFRKKLRGRAASDYRTLISSGLFPNNGLTNPDNTDGLCIWLDNYSMKYCEPANRTETKIKVLKSLCKWLCTWH